MQLVGACDRYQSEEWSDIMMYDTYNIGQDFHHLSIGYADKKLLMKAQGLAEYICYKSSNNGFSTIDLHGVFFRLWFVCWVCRR